MWPDGYVFCFRELRRIKQRDASVIVSRWHLRIAVVHCNRNRIAAFVQRVPVERTVRGLYVEDGVSIRTGHEQLVVGKPIRLAESAGNRKNARAGKVVRVQDAQGNRIVARLDNRQRTAVRRKRHSLRHRSRRCDTSNGTAESPPAGQRNMRRRSGGRNGDGESRYGGKS